jgi:serine/threonine-protein kinase
MRIQSSEKWQQVEAAFGGAVELPSASRTRYLDETCSTDPEIRAAVERLLRANDQAGDFLETLDGKQAAALLDESTGEEEHFIGRYKVIQQLGTGGMGVVYLAEDPSLKRRVAVKVLPPYLHADSVANRRFLEEARAASALDHPNIATVHEIGETDDGRLFITMTYYEGETLRTKIDRGRVDIGQALDITEQTASGLAAAHRKGIIHRDIKPENVLVTTEGLVKIVDFGIAKVAGQALTQTGMAVGTAAYMSPEQTFGTEVDHRTDLWSLGVVLYEMLAGERPFRGDRQEAIIFAIRSDPLRLDQKLPPNLPQGLTSIIDRCLQKDPNKRYASAADLAEDVRAVRSGAQGVLHAETRAAAESAPRKLITAVGTPKRRVSMALAIAAVLVAGFFVARGLMSRERSVTAATNGGAGGATGARLASNPVEEGSIAVLPFANMSPSPERDYIGDGITDELIHALSRVERLRVVSRTSSFQFKGKNVDVRDVGNRLGVSNVLEGSVRSAGDKLRVTVQLIDARNGYELWSEAFDRSMNDIVKVQEEIARAVVEKLRIRVPGAMSRLLERSPTDPEAYALYLKGRHLWNERRDLPESIKYFEQAIARDSTFALAYLGLGQAWINLPFYTDYPLVQSQEKARAAILKALALDGTLADAYGSLGAMAADNWQWKEAESYFRRAIELSGGDATTRQWYGEMLMKVGRIDDGIRQLRIAQRLNPLSPIITSTVGWALYSAGRQAEAVAAFQSAARLHPEFAHTYEGLGSAYIEQGRFEEAIAQFQKGADLLSGRQSSRAYLARAYALGGRRREAEAMLGQLEKDANEKSGSPWDVALVAMSLGRKEQVMPWLERAYEVRDFPLAFINIDPAFKELRSDPRFVRLLKRMGFEA